MCRNYQQAVDKLCDLLIIQKEAEAVGSFGALVAVDVHLVGFELVRLLPCDALNVAAALDRQHAVRNGQVFARVFAVPFSICASMLLLTPVCSAACSRLIDLDWRMRLKLIEILWDR